MLTYLLGALVYIAVSFLLLAGTGYTRIFNSREKRYVEIGDDEP